MTDDVKIIKCPTVYADGYVQLEQLPFYNPIYLNAKRGMLTDFKYGNKEVSVDYIPSGKGKK